MRIHLRLILFTIRILEYIQRKFRSETSDNMESWRAEQRSRVRRWKAEKRSRVRRKKIQVCESQKKEDTHARNVRKVAKRCAFPNPMICVSAESKSRLAKAAGAEPCRQRRVGQFDPSVFLLCHRWLTTTNVSYRFPILETSATAFCGTTGSMNEYSLYNYS